MSIAFDYVQSRLPPSHFKEERWKPIDLLLCIPIIGRIIWGILKESSKSKKDFLNPNKITHIEKSTTSSKDDSFTETTSSSPICRDDLSLQPYCSVSSPPSPQRDFNCEGDHSLQPDCSISSPPSPRNQAPISSGSRHPRIEMEIRELQTDERITTNKASDLLKKSQWTAEEMISGFKILNELKTLKTTLKRFGETSSAGVCINNLESRLKVQQKECDLKFAEAMKRKVAVFCENPTTIPHLLERSQFLKELKALNGDLITKYHVTSLEQPIIDFEEILKKTN